METRRQAGRPGGSLTLVPTPIGNLGDMSGRAIEALQNADLIACEDTRTSGRLLAHFGITTQKVSYHEFNERQQAARLTERILAGEHIAIISDAGSPGIADPAYRLVHLACEAGVTITPIPGPCAAIAALTASGLPTDRFFFEGFLPHKGGARRRRYEAVGHFPHTLIFYESPHRIGKSLQDALNVLGDRPACLARELTKLHEEFLRGKLSELLTIVSARTMKGEMVLVIGGNQTDKSDVEAVEEEDDND